MSCINKEHPRFKEFSSRYGDFITEYVIRSYFNMHAPNADLATSGDEYGKAIGALSYFGNDYEKEKFKLKVAKPLIDTIIKYPFITGYKGEYLSNFLKSTSLLTRTAENTNFDAFAATNNTGAKPFFKYLVSKYPRIMELSRNPKVLLFFKDALDREYANQQQLKLDFLPTVDNNSYDKFITFQKEERLKEAFYKQFRVLGERKKEALENNDKALADSIDKEITLLNNQKEELSKRIEEFESDPNLAHVIGLMNRDLMDLNRILNLTEVTAAQMLQVDTIYKFYTNNATINVLENDLFTEIEKGIKLNGRYVVDPSIFYLEYKNIVEEISKKLISIRDKKQSIIVKLLYEGNKETIDKELGAVIEDIEPEQILKSLAVLYGLYYNDEEGNFEDAINITQRAQPIGDLPYYFRDLSTVNNPLTRLIYNTIYNINEKTRAEYYLFEEESDRINNNFLEYSKRNRLPTKYGKYTIFLQLDNGVWTGKLVDKFSNKFYDQRIKNKPTNYKKVAQVKRWNLWKKENVIVLDPRLLFPEAFVTLGGTMPSDAEINRHKQELKEHLGDYYDYYLEKAEEKINKFLSEREIIFESFKSDPNSTILEQIWDNKNSPFKAAERFYDTSETVTINNTSIDYTKWNYITYVPRKFFTSGVETGYYDNYYEQIVQTPELKEFYNFFRDALNHYVDVFPNSMTNELDSNFLPASEHGINILGEILTINSVTSLMNKFKELRDGIIDNTVKSVTSEETEIRPVLDSLGRPKSYLATMKINAYNSKAIGSKKIKPNLYDDLRLFALGAIDYKNKKSIEDAIMLLKNIVDELKEAKIVKIKGNEKKISTSDLSPNKISNAVDIYVKSLLEGKKVNLTELAPLPKTTRLFTWEKTIINPLLKLFYFTTLGWNVKAAVVNLIANMISISIWSTGGLGVNTTDIFSVFWNLLSSSIPSFKIAKDPISLGKVFAITRNTGIFEGLYKEHKITNKSSSISVRKKLALIQQLINGTLSTLSPDFLMALGETLPKVSIITAVYKNTKVTIGEVETSLFDILNDNGRIDSTKLTKEEVEEVKQAIARANAMSNDILKRSIGNYNQAQNPVAIKRGWYTIFATYRSFMAEGIANRFSGGEYSDIWKAKTEGRYVTLGKYIKSGFNKDEFTDWQKANMRKNLAGLLIWTSLLLIMLPMAIKDDEDRELEYWESFILNIWKKLNTELTFYVNPIALVTIVRDVAPILNYTVDILSFILETSFLMISKEGKERVTTESLPNNPLDWGEYMVNPSKKLPKKTFTRREAQWEKAKKKLLPGYVNFYRTYKATKKIIEPRTK